MDHAYVVMNAFGPYEIGQTVSDPDAMAAIEANPRQLADVRRILRPADLDAPAPAPAPAPAVKVVEKLEADKA